TRPAQPGADLPAPALLAAAAEPAGERAGRGDREDRPPGGLRGRGDPAARLDGQRSGPVEGAHRVRSPSDSRAPPPARRWPRRPPLPDRSGLAPQRPPPL